MFEKYKDGDLITLKLMHGEEVISTLESQNETTLEVKKALNDKIAEEYKRVFSSIKTVDKPKIIT